MTTTTTSDAEDIVRQGKRAGKEAHATADEAYDKSKQNKKTDVQVETKN